MNSVTTNIKVIQPRAKTPANSCRLCRRSILGSWWTRCFSTWVHECRRWLAGERSEKELGWTCRVPAAVESTTCKLTDAHVPSNNIVATQHVIPKRVPDVRNAFYSQHKSCATTPASIKSHRKFKKKFFKAAFRTDARYDANTHR